MSKIYPTTGSGIQDLACQINEEGALDEVFGYHTDADHGSVWSDILWPRSRLLSGANACATPNWDFIALSYGTYDWMARRLGGGSERWIVFGQTMLSGAVSANATVTLYDQTTGQQVDQMQSDSNGNYMLGEPFGSGRSIAVAYKTGSPDVSGTSVQNLP